MGTPPVDKQIHYLTSTSLVGGENLLPNIINYAIAAMSFKIYLGKLLLLVFLLTAFILVDFKQVGWDSN